MPLTNKQRAHDIAVASLAIQYDMEKTKLLAIAETERLNGNDVAIDISFDVAETYQNVYETTLENLNQNSDSSGQWLY